MQAVILAAGISKRLRPLTDNTPKCLLEIGGKSFLARMIENLNKYGIKDFVIVTGYLEDKIINFAKEKYPNLNFEFVTNPLYDKTQNSYSLWCAKDKIKGEFILLDGDIVFDHRILKNLFELKYSSCLAVNSDIKLGEEEMKIYVDDKMKVTTLSKNLDPLKSYGESIGIEKFSNTFASKLLKQLDINITEKKETDEYYEKTFQDVINDGEELYAVDISNYKVAEVDTAEDITFAENKVLPYIQ